MEIHLTPTAMWAAINYVQMTNFLVRDL